MSFIDDIKIKREEKKAKKLDAKLDSREKRIDARRKAGSLSPARQDNERV